MHNEKNSEILDQASHTLSVKFKSIHVDIILGQP